MQLIRDELEQLPAFELDLLLVVLVLNHHVVLLSTPVTHLLTSALLVVHRVDVVRDALAVIGVLGLVPMTRLVLVVFVLLLSIREVLELDLLLLLLTLFVSTLRIRILRASAHLTRQSTSTASFNEGLAIVRIVIVRVHMVNITEMVQTTFFQSTHYLIIETHLSLKRSAYLLKSVPAILYG